MNDDIRCIRGIQNGETNTACKKYGESIERPYSGYCNGKWGIEDTAWMNTRIPTLLQTDWISLCLDIHSQWKGFTNAHEMNPNFQHNYWLGHKAR